MIETRDEELEDDSVDETRPVTKSKKFHFNFQVLGSYAVLFLYQEPERERVMFAAQKDGVAWGLVIYVYNVCS